jgi:hypothetical protein
MAAEGLTVLAFGTGYGIVALIIIVVVVVLILKFVL